MQSLARPSRHRGAYLSALAATALVLSAPDSHAQAPVAALSYADFADLALPAPIAAHVRIVRAVRLKDEQATEVPPGKTRFYVQADVVSLIKGPTGLPVRVAYLLDLPNNVDGRAPKLARKSEHLLFASEVEGRPGELRLAAADAHVPFDAAAGQQLRALLREAAAAGAAPRITGVGRSFHVPGSLPGESETQIFLLAADGQPISLNIIRRPGEEPIWAVALSEIVDDAAEPPRRNSLLWYRLACSLPQSLPRQSVAEGDAAAVQADYRLVLDSLGPCERTRG